VNCMCCANGVLSVLQISDPDQIKLIQKKFRLRMPYAGAFLRRTER